MKTLNKILLIDDDYISNVVTQVLLESLGVSQQVETALNGREGLELLKKDCFVRAVDCPDLIMLDINMPVMNGFEFLEAYEGMASQDKPAVVMFTTSDDPRDMEMATQFEKVAGFITKPFELDKFQLILSKLI